MKVQPCKSNARRKLELKRSAQVPSHSSGETRGMEEGREWKPSADSISGRMRTKRECAHHFTTQEERNLLLGDFG